MMSTYTRGLITRCSRKKPESSILVAIILSALLISSCSSTDDDSNDAEQALDDFEAAVSDVELPVDDDIDDDDGALPSEDEGIAAGGNTVDVDGDDLPGLIVEGLNGEPANDVVSPWFVQIDLFRLESKTPGTGDAYIDLSLYDPGLTMEDVIDYYTPELDTCGINDAQNDNDGGSGTDLPPRISGGDSVVINTQSGTWFPLARQVNDLSDEFFYATSDGLPGALPDDATLSVPGDVFPTVAAYPLYEPEPPVRLTPGFGEAVEPDTVFSWIPGNASGSVQIDFIEADADGELIRFAGACHVVDDGSFELPANMLAYVASFDIGLEIRYTRVIQRVEAVDGILYYQESEVAE